MEDRKLISLNGVYSLTVEFGARHLVICFLIVILEPQKIKSDTVSTVYPSICHELMGPDAVILVF